MESKSRDEYREEAILWLHRRNEYLEKVDTASTYDEVRLWGDKAAHATLELQMRASLAGLESIEELEE